MDRPDQESPMQDRPLPLTRNRLTRVTEYGLMLLFGIAIGWFGHLQLTARHAPETSTPATETEVTPGLTRPPGETAENSARLWSELAWAMAARAYDLEEALRQVEQTGNAPEAAIQQAIDQASDQEIATVISAVTQIDEDDLLGSQDLRPFASRLVEVALEGLGGESEGPPPDQRVFFSATTQDFDPQRSAESRFPTDQFRVFAFVELAPSETPRVMVKWVNRDTKRIQTLQSLPYRSERPTWSFLERGGDWDVGIYEVSFYTHDANMQLLA
ncbi:hypothetical protein MK280_14120, partial [Myxococcota bacterium]|nr:hypothetical protein [Myxococcota bacterium]